jgi:predicted acetyltransferase
LYGLHLQRKSCCVTLWNYISTISFLRNTGFVLVRELTASDEAIRKFSIAEFFIMRKYRRRGVGREVAYKLFEMFKGRWSVFWLESNLPAKTFWTRTIAKHSNGEFSETVYSGNPAVEFNS